MKKQSIMKTAFAGTAFIAVFLLWYSAAAGPRSDPAGHWEGAIVLPTGSLGVKVDLSRDEHHSWQGAIDIPAQGLHAFKLYPLSVNGGAIHFAMPGVAGEPQFSGQLVAAAGSITGKFAQSGQEFPFKLDRKEKLIADQSPDRAHGVAGKSLAGHWLGSLAVGPGMELRLTWEITTTASGERKGEMVSVDQGNARIPISALSEKGPGPPRGEEHRSNL